MKSSLFKSISTGYLLFVISNLIGLVLTPFILRHVTNAEYGLYVVSLDIIAWVGLVQFGTASVLGPKIAAFLGKPEAYRDQINQMASTAFFMQILYAFAGMLLFFLVSTYLLDMASLVLKSGRQFSIILGLCAFCAILNQVFSAMIIATKRLYLDSLIQIMATALNAILVVVFIDRLGLMALAYVLLISNVLVLVRSYLLVKRLFPGLVLSLKLFERRDLNFLFGNGIYLAIGGFSMLLITRFDNFIIGKMISLEVVTYFYITGKLFYLLNQILSRLINNFRPYISQYNGAGQFKHIADFYLASNRLLLVACPLLAVLVVTSNKAFVSLWISERYYLGLPITMLLGINFIVQLIVLPPRAILASTLYQVKAHSALKVVEAVCKVGLALLLMRWWGVSGLVVATIVSTFIFSVLPFDYLVRRFFRENDPGLLVPASPAYWLLILVPIVPVLVNQTLGSNAFHISVCLVAGILAASLFIWLRKDELGLLARTFARLRIRTSSP